MLPQRKRKAAELAADFEARYGRKPTDDEFNRIVQAVGADADFHLMRKGRTDIQKPNFFADEQLVASAVLDAIINVREVTIITRDHDVQQQFVKMMKLLDHQYQGLLFAERFAADPSEFECVPLQRTTPELHYYFAADGRFVRKPRQNIAEFIEWLLPSNYRVAPIYCLLFGGKGENLCFSPLDYTAEADMIRLFTVKGKLAGSILTYC